MHWRKRTRGCSSAAVLIIALALAPLATASSPAAAVSVTSSSMLAPNLLTSGRTAVYSATWTNGGSGALTHVVAVITLHPGAALASPTPPGCTAAGVGDSVVVSCPHDNLAAGATVSQQLLVTMSAAGTVTAVLTADENTSDRDRHPASFPAPDPLVTIVDATADAAGGCIKNGDQALATRDGLSTANPLITTASLAGPSGVPPCVPVTVQERAPTSPADSCGAGAKCTTDVAVTDFFSVFPDPPSSPVQLTFTVLANNKNLTWYKNGSPVVDCPGATNLPTGVDACVTSRAKIGSSGVRLGVLWRAGPDPSWRG